jgi:D-psicose/D-tagatose/L-ribulose 3-epimerase
VRIGANTWIWVSPLTDEHLATLAPRIAEWGFDVVELPLEGPADRATYRSAALHPRRGQAAPWRV